MSLTYKRKIKLHRTCKRKNHRCKYNRFIHKPMKGG